VRSGIVHAMNGLQASTGMVTLMIAVQVISHGALAQSRAFDPEVNLMFSEADLASVGWPNYSFRVSISECVTRGTTPPTRECHAGSYPPDGGQPNWEATVRFQLMPRDEQDGGPVWWGQVEHGFGILVRIYVTRGALTLTRITAIPGEGYTLTVPRSPARSPQYR
jgi:hypothetical protein